METEFALRACGWARPVFAGLAVVLMACGCRKDEGTKAAESPAPKVTAASVVYPESAAQLSSLTVEEARPSAAKSVRVTGRLAWDDAVTVRVFSPVAGRVTEISSELGRRVEKGETLAKISSPDYGQAQADVSKAEADLILARRTLERTKDLLEHHAAAQKDLDAAEDGFRNAEAEKLRALARLRLYGGAEGVVDQAFSLASPIGGLVVERFINPGQEVRPDQMLANAPNLVMPLFVVSDPTRLWLFLDVAEKDLPLVHPGMKVKFAARPYPGRVFEAIVDWVGDSFDPLTRAVRVRAQAPNTDRALKAEMYVDAEVTLDSEAGRVAADVPTKALLFNFDDKSYYVFVERKPGEFVRRSVRVGAASGANVVIEDGVKPGERVVTGGSLLLDSVIRQNTAS
jgi:membrane fusion protein, heavy metal efflux system